MKNLYEDLQQVSTRQLHQLIHMADPGVGEWQTSELQAILRHQLGAQLHNDFDTSDVARWTESIHPTFAELLFSLRPPQALLKRAKEFAAAHYLSPDSSLPPDVGRTIYYACIVAARLHAKTDISAPGDPDPLTASRWGLSQSWMDPRCRELFAETVGLLGATSSATS